MSSFSTEIKIQASVEQVWSVLADIGHIDRWNPGVVESHVLSDQPAGLGASRYCNLGDKNFLNEEVVTWEEGKRLTMRITDTNLPLRADIQFTLRPENGSSVVTVSPEYTVKYGPLGWLLDRFYVRSNYEKGMNALLAGLKAYVEDDDDLSEAETS
jgi:uncharacterized protein YndB with AHSA1/START domain